MDEILKGILISDHPEPLKNKIIQRIIMQAEQRQEASRVKSILELAVKWCTHGSTKFELRSGIGLYAGWAKHNSLVVQDLFTEEYLLRLMTQKCENPSFALILVDKTLTVLDRTRSFSVLSETFSKLCVSFLESNPNLECLYTTVQILIKFEQCVPRKRISDLCKIIIDILSKTEIPEDYSDKITLLKNINLIADFLKKNWNEAETLTVEDSLLTLFTIVSSPDTHPSQCLGGIISCLPLKMIGETFNLTHMSNIGEVDITRAIVRMICWLQWPTSRHVDIWVIAIFEELEFMKKYDILIELTDKNVEFLFNCLTIVLSRDEALKILSHMLLRCQQDPAPFHKILKSFPDLFQKLQAEKSVSSSQCLKDLIELFHILMYIHSGFPDLYEPILELCKETPVPEVAYIKAVIEKYSGKRWGSSNALTPRRSGEFLSMSPTKRLGLYNLSNTCYMNCIIQVLFLLDDFRRHLLRLSSNSKQILYEMQRLFSFLLSSHRPAISPKSFYDVSNPSSFNRFEQQDCMEFFTFLIDKLDEEERSCQKSSATDSTDNRSDAPSTLANHFTGKIRNMFHCSTCSETFVQSNDSFTTINLAFPEKREPEHELPTMLKDYFQPEEMTGSDRINCTFCKSLQNGKRWVEILEPPQYLKLILMRFSYDSVLRKKVKIMNRVKYPTELTIPFVDPNSDSKALLVYILCSVIVHSGSSSDSGHYYCFGRHSSTAKQNPSRSGGILKDEWFLFNDERVTYTEFMSSQKLSSYPQDTPYSLIYRLVETDLLENTTLSQEMNIESDQIFIPMKFQTEIRRDNAAYQKERF